MSVISTTRGNPQASDIAVQTATPMLGGASREDAQTVISSADSELAKLFEDRNVLLADGGTLSYATGSPSILSLTATLKLIINSRVSGGSPVTISLTGTSFNFSADGSMLYAVIDRSGSVTMTSDASSLPAVAFADQEVFLIAKRIDGATERVYFRNGQTLGNGESTVIGSAAVSPVFQDNTFEVVDSGDNTKKIVFDAAGTAGTKTTIQGSQTADRVVTIPDATTTLAGLAVAQTFTQVQTFAANIQPNANASRNSGASALAWLNTYSATLVIGQGDGTGTPTQGDIIGPAASGTDLSGADVRITAGNGTGTGGSGNLIFRTAPSETTGTTPNVPAQVGLVDKTGMWTFGPTAGQVAHVIRGTLSFNTTETTQAVNGIRRSATNTLALSTNSVDRLTINTASVTSSLNVLPSVDNTLTSGSAAAGWSNTFSASMVVGQGDASGTTTGGTIRGPARTGTDVAGVDTTFDAANGTGTGGSGKLLFRTAASGVSSSTANTFATVGQVDKTGAWVLGATGTSVTQTINGRFLDVQSDTNAVLRLKAANTSGNFQSIQFINNTASGKFNFSIGNQVTVSNHLEFLASSAVDGTTFSTVGGFMTQNGAWTLGISGLEDPLTFRTRSVEIPISAGSNATSAMHLGGSGGGYSSISFNARPTSTSNQYDRLSNDTASVLVLGGSGPIAYSFYGFSSDAAGTITTDSSSLLAQCSTSGAWILGPTDSTSSHRINGSVLDMVGAAAGASTNLRFNPKGSSNNAYIESQIVAGDDTGSTAVMQFDVRRTSGATVATRRLFSWTNFNATVVGGVDGTTWKNTAGTWSTLSDQRLKTNIEDMSGSLDKIMQLRPVDFDWINSELHEESPRGGFLAQEVELVDPSWVVTTHAAQREADNALLLDNQEKCVNLDVRFTATLVKALQELKQQFDDYVAAHP